MPLECSEPPLDIQVYCQRVQPRADAPLQPADISMGTNITSTRHPAIKRLLADWWPAVLMMACIYAVSSRPASALPNLGWADALVKKGGHVLGYGALALSYWRAMEWKPRAWWMAWVLAGTYGGTDELHQMFVQGRHASPWDVVLFDAPGAALGLWVAWRLVRTRHRAKANSAARS